MQQVSAVIITKNEERNLTRSLPALSWCDEIIVIDSGSTDDTVRICTQFNCNVYYKKFNGYGEQKRYGISIAKNNWILSIDADEVLSDELIAEIKNELKSPLSDGYLISMNFVFMGQEFKYGRENKKYFLRLFDKRRGNFDSSKVHEKVNLFGITKTLKNKIYHYSYHNFAQLHNKIGIYSSYGAEISFKKAKKKSQAAVILSLPFNFFRYYIINGNFLNGINGFYWSVFSSYYYFLKYLKLNEMYRSFESDKARDSHNKEILLLQSAG